MRFQVIQPFHLNGRLVVRGDEIIGADCDAVAADDALRSRCVVLAYVDQSAALALDVAPLDEPPAGAPAPPDPEPTITTPEPTTSADTKE